MQWLITKHQKLLDIFLSSTSIEVNIAQKLTGAKSTQAPRQ